MSRTTAIKLVQSLSKSEKRQFKLLSKKQSGNKDYLDLFDLINKYDIAEDGALEERFRELHPNSSADGAADYLVKVLVNSLVQASIKEDSKAKLLYGLLKVNMFNRRNMPDEGFKELEKLRQTADSANEQLLGLIIYRQIANYYSENNFFDLSESTLVKEQTSARVNLKDYLNLHEHYSLYELLRYRLIHIGKSLSEKDKNNLNDLVLNEIGIINSRSKNSLESNKVHLLFQSYFFTHIGDYRSALKAFYDLNRFFEKNIHLLRTPPIDYFSGLDGILDSLRTMEYYDEMEYYIQKLSALDSQQYPEYFCFLIKKSMLIYRLAMAIGKKDYPKGLDLIKNSDPSVWKAFKAIDYDKQNELFLYFSLCFFHHRDYKKAGSFLNKIILTGKVNYSSTLYKVARLLDIIIHYEQKNLEYLEYEIRSYKRAIKSKQKLLKTDMLIFKAIQLNPDFNKPLKNELLWKQLKPMIASVEHDKYEGQLLKYFDFPGWVKKKFGRQ